MASATEAAGFLLLGLVPSLLLIGLNLSVFLAIQRRRSTCRDASYAHILLLIVLLLLLCQSPRLFLNFWELTLGPFCSPPAWFEVRTLILIFLDLLVSRCSTSSPTG